jgi:hypothetical protein
LSVNTAMSVATVTAAGAFLPANTAMSVATVTAAGAFSAG